MSDLQPGAIRETVTRSVEWADTDASGHHHNSFIMRSVEAAEARLFKRLGVLEEYFGIAPRVHHEVDFRSKLYFGQEATTVLEIESVGRSSMTFRFEVMGEAFEREDLPVPRRLAASGRYVTVHVPHGTEESAPWPERILEKLAKAAADIGT
ncbi:thioesterase family protein [Sinomonas sp. JGH33]|uniref:Thioesterase family protein n=1 Tax=Sinomonas terricola TaxID=3110330 RepID=A0ABU5T3F2_9MICC|nr:thioesterase family protein [Sinomonas sp. JGH33]MEA5454198.1 thioesterase family protein [Sinomonas sp. JGH33]